MLVWKAQSPSKTPNGHFRHWGRAEMDVKKFASILAYLLQPFVREPMK